MIRRRAVLSVLGLGIALTGSGCAATSTRPASASTESVTPDPSADPTSPEVTEAPEPAVGEPTEQSVAVFAGQSKTLKELLVESDVAATVNVAGIDGQYDLGPGPMSVFSVRVISWLKAPGLESAPSAESTIALYQPGGVDDQGVTLETAGDPLLEVGKQYVLFMRKTAEGNYNVTGGPAGRFDLVGDKVTNTYSPVTDFPVGLTLPQFTAYLQAL